MNGQHFNSSGSGNGTPTPPSNSSYPASLSSQSSRDPSPHSRESGVQSHQYGYSNYDQRIQSSHMLVNNVSSMEPNKHQLLQQQQQQQHGLYNTPQKTQPLMNNTTVRSSSQQQGLFNHHSSSPNPNPPSSVSNYNSTILSPPYLNSGIKHNVTPSLNSAGFNSSSLFSSNTQNSTANQIYKNQFQTNPTALNSFQKQNSVDNFTISSQSQLPSSNLSSSSISTHQCLQNIPTTQTISNSISPSFDRAEGQLLQKQLQQQTGVKQGSNYSLSRFSDSAGSLDKLSNQPQISSPPLTNPSSQVVNSSPSFSSQSNNLISTTSNQQINSSFSSYPANSSVHSQEFYSSSSSFTDISTPLQLPSSQPQSHTQVTKDPSPFSTSTANLSSQNLFPSSSSTSTPPPSSIPLSAMPVYKQNDAPGTTPSSVSSNSNQQILLNQPAKSSNSSSPINRAEERHTEGETGAGDEDETVKSVGQPLLSQDTKQPNPVAYSQNIVAFSQSPQNPFSQSQQNQSLPPSIRPSNQFTSSTQVTGQYSQNQNKLQTSVSSNFNYQPPANNVGQPPLPTSQSLQNTSNLGQFNSLLSNAGPNKPPNMPPVTNLNQSPMAPPPNISGNLPPQPSIGNLKSPIMPPVSSGSYQQMPVTTGPVPSYQMPPNSSGYQQKPISTIGPPAASIPPQQQLPPTKSYVSHQQMVSHPPLPPPTSTATTSLGPYQQAPLPSTNLSAQQIPQPPRIHRPFQPGQLPPMNDPKRNLQYQQPNQYQPRPPAANQYQPYQTHNVPLIQSQPLATGPPYGMNRYPTMPNTHGGVAMDGLTNQLRGTNINQDGFNKLWGMDTYDLLKTRDLLPKDRTELPQIRLNPELFEAANCSPELFRCTLTKIPETKSLLDKSRLPLGVLIHPFKDLTQLSVIQCSTIVRCRSCRTYINPFICFLDNKRWKCNLCFRVNELPDEFQFDPMSKTYGDPSRRPEIKSATIEFIAPSEYMVRPPQPAIYLFLFDVSRLGTESGYLEIVCQTLLEELDNLPGDARMSVGFITYDSSVHFYSLAEGLSQPHQMVVVDIDDMFLPCPENLLVNLSECHDLIKDLLTQLPKQYSESYNTESALGAALQAAYKLLVPTGGRITVFQSRLPSIGPGALVSREDPSQRASDSVPHLNPSTDFYKKLALDCSSQQIAVDLFIVNSQYVDIATLSGVSRFSGGCIYHFPLFRNIGNSVQVISLKRTFQRYLTRKIGFESVMRLRCTRGLSIHTFHGNFFVRSTDLLSLPNVNPDAGFGMQVSIDESLSELRNVFFQAALLYTSSKGERRIRVHTLCLPVASNLSDILNAADQHCIVGLLAKMAVDRSIESSLTDAREAFINVAADILSAYKLTQNCGQNSSVLAPTSLRLIPMYILALLKSVAFRTGQSTRLDDRVYAMCQMKTLPLNLLLQSVYPDLYPVHNLEEQPHVDSGDENPVIIAPQRLHLSSEKLDSHGVFLLDNGTNIFIYVGHNINASLCQALFGVPHFAALPQDMYVIPELSTPENERLRDFVFLLQSEKPFDPCIQIIRDDSQHRGKFLEHLIEDKNEAGTSYYEFLQRLKVLMK